jgi:hypothetical protein
MKQGKAQKMIFLCVISSEIKQSNFLVSTLFHINCVYNDCRKGGSMKVFPKLQIKMTQNQRKFYFSTGMSTPHLKRF